MEQPQYSVRVKNEAWFINEVPADAKTLALPENGNFRFLALTLADESGPVRSTQPLYDTLERLSNRDSTPWQLLPSIGLILRMARDTQAACKGLR